MSAVALRCDADADRMLAHLRERFAEVFPVTGSAGDGAGGDAGGNPDEGADGSADAAVRFAPVADRGSFAFASAPGRLEVAGNHVGPPGRPRHLLGHRRANVGAGGRERRTPGAGGHGGFRHRCDRLGRCGLAGTPWCGDPVLRCPSARHAGRLRRGRGGTLRGFDLATCSEVPAGCGLSSSAAFEVMVGAVLEGLFGPGPFAGAPAPAPGQDAAEGGEGGFVPLDPVALALAGVTAEQALLRQALRRPGSAGQRLRRHGASRFRAESTHRNAACLRCDGSRLFGGAH